MGLLMDSSGKGKLVVHAVPTWLTKTIKQTNNNNNNNYSRPKEKKKQNLL